MVCVPTCSESLPEDSPENSSAMNDQYKWLFTVEKAVPSASSNPPELTGDLAVDYLYFAMQPTCLPCSAMLCFDHHPESGARCEFWSNPSCNSRSTTLCHCETNSVVLVRYILGAEFCPHAWRPTHSHIEKAFMTTIGDWLHGSGWTSVLVRDVLDIRFRMAGYLFFRFESLPPTQAALTEHIKRAAFQSGHCWHQSLQAQQNLPAASDWGWKKVLNKWQPVWTTLPPVGEVASQLVRSKCVKGCTKHCKCVQAKLAYTALCRCNCLCVNSTQNWKVIWLFISLWSPSIRSSLSESQDSSTDYWALHCF